MNVVKISVFIMDPGFMYKFRKRAGCSFWDAFKKRFVVEFDDLSVENEGNTQAVFYAPSDMEPEEIKKAVSNLISELSDDSSDSSNHCIIAVVPISEKDIERITQNNSSIIESKDWFSSYVRSVKSGGTQTVAEPPVTTPNTTAQPSQTRSRPESTSVSEQSAQASVNQAQNQPAGTLSAEIDRIINCKNQLLKIVHGQRHAIDVFVDTVFECDAFSSVNKDRKEPLASFLFVGPPGVGKSFLAKQAEPLLGRKCCTIDMSSFTGNLSHTRLIGEHGDPNELTGFARKYPDGIIIFDEVEKAHINTIQLLLRLLNDGILNDAKINKEISFRNNIIIFTTNAGQTLYDDPSVCDLSHTPRKVILDALRKDKKPLTEEPLFPECIISRFANGHIVLFNHLEPYSLLQIIKDELEKHTKFFKMSFGIDVNYDADTLAAMILYHGGGVADARTLTGLTRQIFAKEIQNCITQVYKKSGEQVNNLEKIEISFDINLDDDRVSSLFVNRDTLSVLVFCDKDNAEFIRGIELENTKFNVCTDVDEFKKNSRGVVDFAVIDPTAGMRKMDCIPHDIEDYVSDGMDMYDYFTSFYTDIPVYMINSKNREESEFDTFMDRGSRGVIVVNNDAEAFIEQIKKVAQQAHINNATFSLSRSGKVLNYNCSQYNVDEKTAYILFTRMAIGFATSSDDSGVLDDRDRDNGVKFEDIIGCESAKEALREFCDFIKNPREYYSQGKHVPKGVLLYGPPGTGKTMLAKAMANETDVAFLPTTATSFFASHVGESEKNIRDLFARARRYAPSIIFIDEVDAIARQRTGGETTVHYENALNELIAQMEGFVSDDKRPIFLIAATNYDISGSEGKVLDEAFVRRFDKRILIDLLDTEGRKKFFAVKFAKHGVCFGEDQDTVLNSAAQHTVGLNNSDLDKIVNMFLTAISDSEPTGAVLLDMIDSFRYGEVKKMKPDVMRRVAFHESGHALVYRLLGKTPSYLTIVSRGDFGGYMAHQVEDDFSLMTFNMMMDSVCCSLAGRVAEIEFFGSELGLNTGAGSDLSKARLYIKAALDDYAMGETLYTQNKEEAAEKLMKEQYDRTVTLIHEHRDILEKLAERLIQSKSLDQAQLEDFFESAGC